MLLQEDTNMTLLLSMICIWLANKIWLTVFSLMSVQVYKFNMGDKHDALTTGHKHDARVVYDMYMARR